MGLRSPMVYIFMFVVGLLVFFAVVSDNVMIGGAVGDVHKNAPAVVGSFVSIMTIFGVLFATAFFNNAALRDYQYNFSQILFSTPLDKAGYFFGRFAGAWLLATMVLLGVYLGMTLGSILAPAFDWLGPGRLGPIPWGAYLSSYLLFVLPNMLFAGSIIFLLATRFKSTVISFVGALLIVIGYTIALDFASDLDSQATGALVDVFGISAYRLDTQYLTPAEQNLTGPAFAGYLLTNRLIWTGGGLVLLLLAYQLFSFSSKQEKSAKPKKAAAKSTAPTTILALAVSPSIAKDSPVWLTFWSFFSINLRSMLKNTTFIILLLFAALLLLSDLWNGFEYFGLQSYPVTYKMIDSVNGQSVLFVMIILVFFSGELIWRDRDNHLNEVIDGTPHRSLVSLVAKATSLVALASILHLMMMGIAILYQAAKGYTQFELGIYANTFFAESLPYYIIWAGVFIFLQVLINQKYIAYFASVLLLFLLDLIYLSLRVESRMLSIGSTPQTIYSDMNGLGPGLEGHYWFSIYWMLLGILLLLAAAIVWPRGINKGLKERFGAGRKSLGSTYYAATGVFGLAFLGVAAFVFYNTQVLNTYKTSKEQENLQIAYEKTYKKYEEAPTVRILDAKYHLDIYPEERAAKGRIELLVTNPHTQPLDSLFFTIGEDYQQRLDIPNSELLLEDLEHGFLIYRLKPALAPGDTMAMTTYFDYSARGFEDRVSNLSVIENGTFLNNLTLLPRLGYMSDVEISDKNKRRKLGLPERKQMPDLEENCSQSCMRNYLTQGTSDWVTVETFIRTSADQIAIAPGSLLSKSEEAGRVKYHYRVDHPSQHFFSFSSARYAVATRKWEGVDIEVYYHPAHEVNVERMLDAVEKSLEYYTSHFGPYFHKQARIIEFPRYSTFAQAFPGTMPYSEAFGFIINLEGENKNNIIDAVIAHEMAHQYWAHQVIGANMKGSTMLSESFAEYSSLMVMKQSSDEKQMKDFLKYDMNRYLRGRSDETEAEQPLLTVENQSHIHYGKGSVILYALQDYIGEERVNAALSNFLADYRYAPPPYPTSLDFMRYLRPEVPDSLQYLLTDWFEDITLYDLRMNSATAKKLDNGQYEITLDLTAKKLKADGAGNTQEETMADWVDIGLYEDRAEEKLLLRQRIYLDQEKSIRRFIVDQLPAKAAIDPLQLLIDRVKEDNVVVVEGL